MRPPSLPGSVVVSSSRPERAGRSPVLDGLVGGSILYRLVPWIAGHPALLNRDAMHGGDGQGGMLPTAVVICPTQVGGPDLPMGGHMAHVRTRGGPATPCPSYGPEGAWAGTPHRPVPLRHGFPRRARSRQPRKRTLSMEGRSRAGRNPWASDRWGPTGPTGRHRCCGQPAGSARCSAPPDMNDLGIWST